MEVERGKDVAGVVALLHAAFPRLATSFLKPIVADATDVLVVGGGEEVDSSGGPSQDVGAGEGRSAGRPPMPGTAEDAVLDEDEEDLDDEDEDEEGASDSESEDEEEEAAVTVRAALVYRVVELANPTIASFFEEAVAPVLSAGQPQGPTQLGTAVPQQPCLVLSLSLLAVAPQCQGRGYGRQLIDRAVEAARSRGCTAVVAHADASSTPFFRHLGWSDDPLLNSRYASIPTPLARHVTLSLSLLPPHKYPFPTPASGMSAGLDYVAGVDVAQLVMRWSAAKAAAHSEDMWLLSALRTEVCTLRAELDKRDAQLRVMAATVRQLQRELRDSKGRAGGSVPPSTSAALPVPDVTALGDVSPVPPSEAEPLVHAVAAALPPGTKLVEACVVAVGRPPAALADFQEWKSACAAVDDASPAMPLYVVGSDLAHVADVCCVGFVDGDTFRGIVGEYATGVHASLSVLQAVPFALGARDTLSGLATIIVGEGCLGRTATSAAPQPATAGPPVGFDSLMTPGRSPPSQFRLSEASAKAVTARLAAAPGALGQEAVLFRARQVLATHVIAFRVEYSN